MISLAEQCDQRATEFQSGKPPAGEAGMMLCDGEWWKFWDGQRWFNGNSGSIKKAWEAVRNGQVVQFPVRRCRPANLPELLAAGLTEAEALPMLHKSMLPEAAQEPTSEQVEQTQTKQDAAADAADKAQDEASKAKPKDMHERDDEGLLNGIWARHTARQAQKSDAPPPPPPETPDGLLYEHRADKWGRVGFWGAL